MFNLFRKTSSAASPAPKPDSEPGAIPEILSEADFDRLRDNPSAVLFKHSPSCPVSRAAMREVRDFVAANPAVPVSLIHVVHSRALSQRVAGITKIRHESPQTIVFRNGEVIGDLSHEGVTAEELETVLAR